MQIAILNGNPDPAATPLEKYLNQLQHDLQLQSHVVHLIHLRELSIRPCVGCFDCWLKNPGRCNFQDDHIHVLRTFIAADLFLLAAPLVMGFPSALLKKAVDRMIPLILPYLDGSSGEFRHFLRYDRSPRIGLIVEPEADTDEEDLAINRQIWERFGRNVHSEFVLFRTTQVPVPEVVHAIAGL